jgi:Domain of unknown function (DUF1929)/PKD domain
MTSFALAALAAPGAWAHESIATAQGHAEEDAVTHTAAQERALDARTLAASASDAKAAAAAVAAAPQDVGEWGPRVDWPVVGVHVALLPNGKVLAYDSVGDNATETYPVHDHTRATVWDPATGSQTDVKVDTGFNIFCSGLAHLEDGRLFVAGGNKDSALNGIPQTHVFNPVQNLWSLGPTMAAGRWYPSVTPLNNGEMLITSGRVNTPEVRQLDGTLRSLSSASLSQPLYPWMDVAPDGRTFSSGPDQTLRELDTTGTGAWRSLGQRDPINRDYGGHALFDVGKMLVAGGGPSTKDARVIDFGGATPRVSATAPMAYGRRQHNLTVLADGSVLATGGNSSGASLVDLNNGVYPAERWDPATGQWATLAAMQVTRQYHSTALLLPDGRVLSSGGGICGTCDQVGYLARNAEIFTPPYLFQADGTLAPRPAITAAPAAVGFGAPFDVASASAASIRKVALVRLGAVTHSDNMEQRYIPLTFTAAATSLTATAPSNANVAPPGPYMLVIVDANGVPSVARMVSVHQGPTAVATATPTDGAAPLAVQFDGSGSTGAGLSFAWDLDGDGAFDDSTAAKPTRTYGPGTYQARLRVSDANTVTAVSPVLAISARAPGGATGTPTGSTAPTPRPPTAKPRTVARRVRLKHALVVRRDGTLRWRVRCRAAVSCPATLVLRPLGSKTATLARAARRVPAGATRTVTLKLRRSARAKLRARGSLRAVCSVDLRPTVGARRRTDTVLRLRAPAAWGRR